MSIISAGSLVPSVPANPQTLERIDLCLMIERCVARGRLRRPAVDFVISAPPTLELHARHADLSNLLSHLLAERPLYHCVPREVRIHLQRDKTHATLRVVQNLQTDVQETEVPKRSDASSFEECFKPLLLQARRIVKAHEGFFRADYHAPHAVFVVGLPLSDQA
jgi:hypothetical protein